MLRPLQCWVSRIGRVLNIRTVKVKKMCTEHSIFLLNVVFKIWQILLFKSVKRAHPEHLNCFSPRVLILPKCRKYSHMILVTHEIWFLRLFKGALSCRQKAKNELSGWTGNFTTRQKAHFKATKMERKSSQEPRSKTNMGSRLGGSGVFRHPKCRKWGQRFLWPLELWVSQLGRSRVFRPQNAENGLKGA